MRTHRGFTMVELIVVIVVMAILGAVAIPRLMDHRALQEMGFQDQLQAMMRHARKVAVSQQRTVCVSLVTVPARQVEMVYAVGAAASCTGTAVEEPGSTTPFVTPIPPQLSFSGVTVVRFDANGRPYPNNVDQNLTVGARVLRVSRETGLVYWP